MKYLLLPEIARHEHSTIRQSIENQLLRDYLLSDLILCNKILIKRT